MLKYRISDNVGGVKHFLSILRHALRKERHFALAEGFCCFQPRLACNQFRSKNSVRPMHLFGPSSIMITSSNSSVRRSGLLTQLLDVLLHTIAISELARVRTELVDCS